MVFGHRLSAAGKIYAFVTKPARDRRGIERHSRVSSSGGHARRRCSVPALGLKAMFTTSFNNTARFALCGSEERHTFGFASSFSSVRPLISIDPSIQFGAVWQRGHSRMERLRRRLATGFRARLAPATWRPITIGCQCDQAGMQLPTFNPLYFKAVFSRRQLHPASNIIDVHPTCNCCPVMICSLRS